LTAHATKVNRPEPN